MTLEQIREQVVHLSDQEKGLLAEDILTSMPPPEYDVSDEDVQQRIRQLEVGEIEDISFDELKKRIGR